MSCTITKNLEIVTGTRADYESLSRYHYRESRRAGIGPYAAIFSMRGEFRTAEGLQTAGVIVYSMPVAGCRMRSGALGMLSGLDRKTRLKIISKNIRTISRVIIEPRFRSLGLAARLVRETMPLMNVPFVEALAVMGRVNPFFEKAGMTRYDAPASAVCVRLISAFGAIGIDEQDLIYPQTIQKKLDSRLRENDNQTEFIEREIVRFLQSYGPDRSGMKPGIERTRFIVSKLTDSPVYYLWKNPNIELRI